MNNFSENQNKSRTPLITFLAMMGIIVFLFGSYMLMGYFMEDTIAAGSLSPEEQKNLDALYEKEDYEQLVNYASGLDSASLRLLNYEHYDLLNYYGQYMEVRDIYVPELDKKTLSQSDARRLTEFAFSFYYRCYDRQISTTGNIPEKDLEILDGVRDYMLSVLYDRLGYSQDDMEAARSDIMENNYFHAGKVDRYSDSYSERYK